MKSYIEIIDNVENGYLIEGGDTDKMLAMLDELIINRDIKDVKTLILTIKNSFPDADVGLVKKWLKNSTYTARLNPTMVEKLLSVFSALPPKVKIGSTAVLTAIATIAAVSIYDAGKSLYKKAASQFSSEKYTPEEKARIDTIIQRIKQRPDADTNPDIKEILDWYKENFG